MRQIVRIRRIQRAREHSVGRAFVDAQARVVGKERASANESFVHGLAGVGHVPENPGIARPIGPAGDIIAHQFLVVVACIHVPANSQLVHVVETGNLHPFCFSPAKNGQEHSRED